MTKRFSLLIAAMLLLGQSASAAQAGMSVVPAVVQLEEAGNGRSAALKVYNDQDRPLPVQFVVQRFELNEDGSDQVFPADGEVTVFPPQALIKPGATQVVNVIWTGKQRLEQSRSYYVTVHQVPVKFDSQESGWSLTFNFSVIANVAPANAEARLSILDTQIVPIPQDLSKAEKKKKKNQGTHQVIVTAENTGNRHAQLSDGQLHLKDGAWSMTLSGDDLLAAVGAGLVQPGKTRRFVFPVSVPSAPETAVARFQLR